MEKRDRPDSQVYKSLHNSATTELGQLTWLKTCTKDYRESTSGGMVQAFVTLLQQLLQIANHHV